jgi:hypothetical protein
MSKSGAVTDGGGTWTIENLCRGCWKPSEYQYCDECSKTAKCAHGKLLNNGCSECDFEGDLAFDAWRENR